MEIWLILSIAITVCDLVLLKIVTQPAKIWQSPITICEALFSFLPWANLIILIVLLDEVTTKHEMP